MKKSVYISGKITGLDEQATRERFKKVQKEFEKKNYDVINPFDATDEFVKEFGGNLSWGDAMICCLISLNHCDEIYMLDGWTDSIGARIERDFASRLGLVVRYEDMTTENKYKLKQEIKMENLEEAAKENYRETIKSCEKSTRAIDLPMSEMQKGMLEEQKSKKTLNLLFW